MRLWSKLLPKLRLTWVDSVKIIKVGSEPKPVDCALNVLLNVCRRVGDSGLRTEDRKSTFRCNYATITCQLPYDAFITEVADDYQRLCHGRCAS